MAGRGFLRVDQPSTHSSSTGPDALRMPARSDGACMRRGRARRDLGKARPTELTCTLILHSQAGLEVGTAGACWQTATNVRSSDQVSAVKPIRVAKTVAGAE